MRFEQTSLFLASMPWFFLEKRRWDKLLDPDQCFFFKTTICFSWVWKKASGSQNAVSMDVLIWSWPVMWFGCLLSCGITDQNCRFFRDFIPTGIFKICMAVWILKWTRLNQPRWLNWLSRRSYWYLVETSVEDGSWSWGNSMLRHESLVEPFLQVGEFLWFFACLDTTQTSRIFDLIGSILGYKRSWCWRSDSLTQGAKQSRFVYFSQEHHQDHWPFEQWRKQALVV